MIVGALFGFLPLAIWLYLLLARRGFWLLRERDTVSVAEPLHWPSVVAVVPARNEADVIQRSIGSLLAQDYRGDFRVVLVDDQSDDGTGDLARALNDRRLTVITGEVRPPGWTGKLWALDHGINHVDSMAQPPDYLLLTDADICHSPDTLTRLVARASRDGLVLASLMAKLRCESVVERAFMPAFVFFFQMLYPFAWVNNPRRSTAAAAGGCMLVHRAALSRAGGVAAIRDDLIDDCAFARLLKRQGPIWIGLSKRVTSLRIYRSYGTFRRMIIRTAFAQLRYSYGLLAFTIVSMTIVFIAPPVVSLFAGGISGLAGLLAWALMAAAFQPTSRFYRVSPLWGVALPAIAACYMALTVDSAIQHVRGRGGEWKGRVRRDASTKASSRLRKTGHVPNANGD